MPVMSANQCSALLDHSARGVQIIVHFMFRCSSNQSALVAQMECTSCALAVTFSSGFAVYLVRYVAQTRHDIDKRFYVPLKGVKNKAFPMKI